MDRITMDARGQKWGQLQNPRNLLEHTVPNCITARLNKVNEERLLPEVMQQARKTFTKKVHFRIEHLLHCTILDMNRQV